ncbi:hypothetical protein [Actinoplanes sp. NPDC051494]|uniref:hypothetical protein n=1 Tax=Actinoplanes sp. NPDC051494 TaxID=3363907 RepID=UPI00379ACD3E
MRSHSQDSRQTGAPGRGGSGTTPARGRPLGMLELQRLVGNAAVTSQVAQRSPLGEAVMRAPSESAQTLLHGAGASAQQGPVVQRATSSAKIGFEFQQLNSDVRVTSPAPARSQSGSDDGFTFGNDSESSSSSSSSDGEYYDLRGRFPHYGPNGWWVVQDGRNLEFVTSPIATGGDVAAIMGEIRSAANFFRAKFAEDREGSDSEEFTEFRIGTDRLVVLRPDDRGQPQVNPDIPLDALTTLYQQSAGDFDTYHSADNATTGGFWEQDATRQELATGAAVAGRVGTLAETELRKAFKMPETATAAQVADVRGLLQAIAAGIVHKVAHPTGLPKDMPILLKTSFPRLMRSLLEAEAIAAGIKLDDVVDLVAEVWPDLLDDERGRAKAKNFVGEILRGQDPVWGSTKDPVDIGTGENEEERKQILIELRRNPVIPIAQWPGFAQGAFQKFIGDPDGTYS